MDLLDRWWAADEEALDLGMSSDDMLLLIEGDDPSYNLGAALFAVHRVGEAACLQTAATPLLDQFTLATNMTSVRESLIPAVTVVSKSLGDDDVYAALLVRDFVDEAEQAAIDLYSSAVAKKVSPPFAANRAGMVYGVPTEHLGEFRKLAMLPIANPIALRDAADRALFTYVGKRVEEEIEAAQEISKAYLDDHNETQDERGRFARLKQSVSETDLKAFLGRKPVAEIARSKPRVERSERTERRERTERKERAERPTTARTESVRTEINRSVDARAVTQRNTMTRKQSMRVAKEIIPYLQSTADEFPDPLAQLPDDADWYDTERLEDGEYISLFTSLETGFNLDRAIGYTDERVRLGHLLNADSVQNHEISVDAPSFDKLNRAAAEQGRMAAEMSGARTVKPIARYVPGEHSPMSAYDSDWVADPKQDPMQAVAIEWLANNNLDDTPEAIAEAMGHVVVLNDRTGDGVWYVYDPANHASRRSAMPNQITEFRIANKVRANKEGGRRFTLDLDPNQIMTYREMVPTYDPRIGAIVNVVYLDYTEQGYDPFDRPIGKADYLKEHNETQDAFGRFMSLGGVTVKMPKPERKERTERKTRTERQERAERPTTVRKPDVRVAAERSTAERPVISRAVVVRQLRESMPAPEITAPKGAHIVIDKLLMNDIKALTDQHGRAPSSIDIKNPEHIRELLEHLQHDTLHGHEINERVDQIHNVAAMEGTSHYYAQETLPLNEDVTTHIERFAREFFADKPKVINARMTVSRRIPHEEGYGKPSWVIDIHGTKQDDLPVVLTNHVGNWKTPIELVLDVPLPRLDKVASTTPDPDLNDISTDRSYDAKEHEADVFTFTRSGYLQYTLRNKT